MEDGSIRYILEIEREKECVKVKKKTDILSLSIPLGHQKSKCFYETQKVHVYNFNITRSGQVTFPGVRHIGKWSFYHSEEKGKTPVYQF